MKTKKSLVVLAFILLSTAIFAQRPKGKVIIEGGPFTLEQVKDSVFLSDSDCDSCNVVPSTIRAHMVGILNMYNSRSMLGQKYTEITEADLPYFFSIAVSTSAQTIKDTVWMNYALNGEMKYFKKKLTAKDGDILTINGLPFMKLKCANLLPLVLEETEEAEVEDEAELQKKNNGSGGDGGQADPTQPSPPGADSRWPRFLRRFFR